MMVVMEYANRLDILVLMCNMKCKAIIHDEFYKIFNAATAHGPHCSFMYLMQTCLFNYQG